MSLLSCASGASVWRGYDYFVENKVLSCAQSGEDTFEGSVSGSGTNIYHVAIDVRHPRRSSCDCPYAEGKRIVCKHKVALFFAAYPIEAEQYIREVEQYEEDMHRRAREKYEQTVQYVNNLSLEELRLALLRELTNGTNGYYDDDFDDDECDNGFEAEDEDDNDENDEDDEDDEDEKGGEDDEEDEDDDGDDCDE